MEPTEDTFRALARSSPWRWRTLHLVRRDGDGQTAEVWVDRPHRMRVLAEGREHWVAEGLDAGAGRVVLTATSGRGPHPPVEPPPPVWGGDVDPVRRPDGLVAVRPDGFPVWYGDPMWSNYSWVAMLDPVELSHHTDVSDVRAEDREGRLVWRAVVRPLAGYDPWCGCCPLLFSLHSQRAEHGDEWAPSPGERYPTAYDVALDVGTGVVVSTRALDHERPWMAFEAEVQGVDEDVAEVFAGWRTPGR